jgi:alpha-galactosidase
MSLWSLMAAPLVYSGDMSKLDAFTINVLCNPEVIEVNQDPLGESALVIKRNDSQFIMIKTLYDGSKAVGLFNRSGEPKEVSVSFSELPMTGKLKVRDLWRQLDLGRFAERYSAVVPAQGVVMVRISK